VQGPHGQFHVFFVDDHRGFDFAGGDHLDVDALFAERAEHFAGHAHMAAHANAHDGHLADLGVTHQLGSAQGRHDTGLQQVAGARIVIAVHGEAEVGFAILADVLDDHVDFDVGLGHSPQNLIGNAWLVRHVTE